jgi:hypothetical protein
MDNRPDDLADRLKLLSDNVLAIEVYLARIVAVVADTKRQLEAVAPAHSQPALLRGRRRGRGERRSRRPL